MVLAKSLLELVACTPLRINRGFKSPKFALRYSCAYSIEVPQVKTLKSISEDGTSIEENGTLKAFD